MHLLKKMLFCCVLPLLPVLPALAQDRKDSTYVFRFVPTDDMFYVPLGDNGAELERLEKTVTAVPKATVRQTCRPPSCAPTA